MIKDVTCCQDTQIDMDYNVCITISITIMLITLQGKVFTEGTGTGGQNMS
jgi:hypothetical protein